MMKKGKLLIAGAALAVSIPTFSYASAEGGSQPNQTATTVVAEENNEQTWSEERHNHQEKLLEIVKTYSPDTLTEWETAISEREDIFSNLDKEDLKEKKKQWKEKLKEEYGSEKEFKREFKGEWKEKREMKREKIRELKKAVKQEDTAKVQKILDELLVNYKERNETIKNRIAE